MPQADGTRGPVGHGHRGGAVMRCTAAWDPLRSSPALAEVFTPLQHLRWDWDVLYVIEDRGGWVRARRRDGAGGWITASAPQELRVKIAADYTLMPVPWPCEPPAAVSGRPGGQDEPS